jgi:hypothetical protein
LSDDTDRPRLNEHQRRHFEVVLAMLQNTLTEVEQLAAAAPSNADALTIHRDDLPAGFVGAIRRPIETARAGIARLAALASIVALLDSRAAIPPPPIAEDSA